MVGSSKEEVAQCSWGEHGGGGRKALQEMNLALSLGGGGGGLRRGGGGGG